MMDSDKKKQVGQFVGGPPAPDNRECNMTSKTSKRSVVNEKETTVKMVVSTKRIPGRGLAILGSCHEVNSSVASGLIKSGSATFVSGVDPTSRRKKTGE